MEEIKKAPRYSWVDAMKAVGIFAIYLGHMEQLPENMVIYLFSFHVPLFFFTAGFFAPKEKYTKMKFRTFAKEKALTLLLPYYFFTSIYLGILVVTERPDSSRLLQLIKSTILGLKNQTPTGGRWFLPCLFAVSLV